MECGWAVRGIDLCRVECRVSDAGSFFCRDVMKREPGDHLCRARQTHSWSRLSTLLLFMTSAVVSVIIAAAQSVAKVYVIGAVGYAATRGMC